MPDRRSATCNYYLCEEAFVLARREGDPLATSARIEHGRLEVFLGRCDIELSKRVRSRFPAGPPWDAAFFDWVASEYDELSKAHR